MNKQTAGNRAVAGPRAPVVQSVFPSPLAGEGRVGASGCGDRGSRIYQVDPGQSGGKAHHPTVGSDDLEWQLGVRQVPGGLVVVAPAEHISGTGPLQVEVDGRRTVDVGEAGVVMRDLKQDDVHRLR